MHEDFFFNLCIFSDSHDKYYKSRIILILMLKCEICIFASVL